MKRRSFLQAVVAAIVGLPAVFSTKQCPATVSIDCELALIEECKVAIIESGGDDVYSWREVTLKFTTNGHFLSASSKPGGRFDIENQSNEEIALWRRS